MPKASTHPATKRLIQLINQANFGRYVTNRCIGQVAQLLKHPASQGDAVAAYWLGMLNWDGWGIPQNRKKALAFLRAASNSGHRTAQFNLGVAYDNGYVVVKTHYQAFRYYSKAARQGHKEAMQSLGSLYYRSEGTAQDYAKARYWYRRSAKLGHADAMCDLARCYQRGVGGRRSHRWALFWLRKAVEAGNCRAMTWLGLEHARKPTENWKLARHWLEQAAEHQQVHAMYLLGVWAESGWVGTENLADALFWLQKAAAEGHEKAALHLAELQGEQF